MAKSAFYIYMLVDPRDGWPYYIGETTDRRQRYRYHCENSGRNLPVAKRNQEIIRAGDKPVMVIIDQAENELAALRKELFWIDLFMARGIDLLNREQQAWLYERYNELATSARLEKNVQTSSAKPLKVRHGKSWTEEEKQRLKESYEEGRLELIRMLAADHQRGTKAVELQLSKLVAEESPVLPDGQ